MAKYYIMPKPGYHPEDLYLTGMSDKNTCIVLLDFSGVPLEVHPYSPSNVERYRAVPHPSLFQKKAIFEYGGRLLTLSEKIYSGFLADGWNPFKQLVYFVVQERERATKEEIIMYIIDDKKYLKNKRKNRVWLSGLINYLRQQGYLNAVEGMLEVGDRKPPLGDNRIPIKAGYNPIFYQMMEFIDSKGQASKGDISDFMIRDIGWIERDPVTGLNSEQFLTACLNHLEGEGYIREVSKDLYEVVKPLEMYA